MSLPSDLEPALCHVALPSVSCPRNPSPILESHRNLPRNRCQSMSTASIQECCINTTPDKVQQPTRQSWKAYYQSYNNTNKDNISSNNFSRIPESHCSATKERMQPHVDEGKLDHTKRIRVKKSPAGSCQHEDLHDTIQRQRELIGKLISVIVKDRLKDQDQSGKSDGESELYYDVEKLLKFTNCCSKTRTSSIAGNINEQPFPNKKKRTRTTTNEKKIKQKRLKKDRRSPKSRAYRSSLSDISLSPASSCSKSKPVKNCAAGIANKKLERDSENQDNHKSGEESERESYKDLQQRALNLMQPDGDSRLFSLRLEFSRQLKALEDSFKESYNEIQRQKSVVVPKPSVKQPSVITPTSNCAGDSEWSPSSVTSSCETEEKVTSLSSIHSSELCIPRKKKSLRHKNQAMRQKDERTGKGFRVHASKKKHPTCGTRRASDVALQKIDQLLRHSESDEVSASNDDHIKGFEERALEKIHESRALWRKISLDMSAFLFSDKMTKYRNSFLRKEGKFKDIPNSSSSNEDHKEKTAASADTPPDEDKFKLPDNAADPSFLVTKFLRLLPESTNHNQPEEKSCGNVDSSVSKSDAEDVSSTNGVNSTSDIFQHPDAAVSEVSPDNSSLIHLNFDDDEACDPNVIGEVVVVTTEDQVTESCNSDWLDDRCEEICTFTGHENEDERFCKAETAESSCNNRKEREVTLCSSTQLKSASQKSTLLIQQFRPLSPKANNSLPKVEKRPSPQYLHQEHAAPYPSATGIDTLSKSHSSGGEPVLKMPQNEIRLTDVFSEDGTSVQGDDTDDLIESSVFDETDKTLARPLKNLISDVTFNGHNRKKANIVEWGLVPRKAMDVAKQRIQEQLCGEKAASTTISDVTHPKTSRRLSLRSHSLMTSSGSAGESNDATKTKWSIGLKKNSQPLDGSTESLSEDDKVSSSSDAELPPVPWLQNTLNN